MRVQDGSGYPNIRTAPAHCHPYLSAMVATVAHQLQPVGQTKNRLMLNVWCPQFRRTDRWLAIMNMTRKPGSLVLQFPSSNPILLNLAVVSGLSGTSGLCNLGAMNSFVIRDGIILIIAHEQAGSSASIEGTLAKILHGYNWRTERCFLVK